MPTAKPEVQWTMNNTLAAIGIHDPKLRKVWVEFMVKRQR
jgi:hypothetical protein